MEAAAKDLDFIEAARLRDEIKSLQNILPIKKARSVTEPFRDKQN